MTRGMTSAMDSATEVHNRPVWIIRLDIETDPVYMWTGRGTYAPAALETGDPALDGNTFVGLGNIGSISPITDTAKGSDVVRLTLPGVDLQEPLLQEVIFDARKWQYRQAWIWVGFLDVDLDVILSPTRVKTGRMDQMRITGDGREGKVIVDIESHQSNVQRALDSRYSQQKSVEPTDTSQDYIQDLSNKNPGAGVRDSYAIAIGIGNEGGGGAIF